MNLNQVAIPSLDVKKASEFYKILGLRLIVDALPRYVRFDCPDGDATFSIHKVDEIKYTHGTTIYFEDDNLDNWIIQLQKRGIVFKELPKDQSYFWREAKLQDPNDKYLILYHAGENRKSPPWRVPSNSM